MGVVAFPDLKRARTDGWNAGELQRLSSACAEAAGRGEASGWDVGATERGEPQFYVHGPAPDHDCILCISRLGRRYVIEDGRGRLVFEHDNLVRLAGQATVAMRRRRLSVMAQLAVCWCSLREFFDEKIEPLMAEPMELLAHVAPQLSILA